MPFKPRYGTLVELYGQSLEAFGPRELFGTKKDGRWSYLTFAGFGAQVERFRAGLSSLGVLRGDRVAIIANNRVEWAVAAYSSYLLGAAFVPMYEAQNPAEWAFIVRDSEAKVLIVANERVLAKAATHFEGVPTLRKIVLIDGETNGDARVTSYASLLGSTAGAASAPSAPAPEDVATILYTSGTTGNPKGVILTHGNIASNVSGAHEYFPIRASDRSLSILPWAHAFGQTAELHTLFSYGAAMALSEGMDKILDNLAEVRPTVLCCVPTIFNRLYTAVRQQLESRPKFVQTLAAAALRAKAKERAGRALGPAERIVIKLIDALVFKKVRARLGGRLEFAISGGAALSREVAEFIDSVGIVIYEGYGLTETSPVAAANSPRARKIGSVGRAFPGVRIEIDPSTAERETESGPSRREGEVVIYGPNVMKGYLHRPEENAAVFTPTGGFRSGDMGYLDEDQFLFITGRIKEQYKLENGKYVVPSPLEDKLKLSPYVANVMIYGANRPHNVALVVPSMPAIRKWAAANHLELPPGDAELSKHPRVLELFASEIKAHSQDFKGFERIVAFALLPGEFTVDNGILTPKMSVKRSKVVEVYGEVIAQLYAGDKTAGRA